jgi:hypothetical protein
VLIVIAAILVTSCSLFGPLPGRINKWLELPAPGATYTYTVTTTWHDGSRSSEDRDYLVERVEMDEDGNALVKLADEDHLSALYWIVEASGGAIYESRDDTIDGSDLLVLAAPVEEGASWTFGTDENRIDYEIEGIAWRESVELGKVRDLVTVTADSADAPEVDITIEW